MRALAQPERTASRRFHERLGFTGRDAPDTSGPARTASCSSGSLPLDGEDRPGDSATIARPTADPRGFVVADPSPHDDRREHRREDVELPARIVADGEVVDAQSVNLSEGGILLAGADFPSASQVRIEIELAEMGWHALEAEVVRTARGERGGHPGRALRRGRDRGRSRRHPRVLRVPPRRGRVELGLA